MPAAAFDVGRFGLAFAVRAAIFTVGARVAVATWVRALLFFFHDESSFFSVLGMDRGIGLFQETSRASPRSYKAWEVN